MYNEVTNGYSRQEQMKHAQKRTYGDQEAVLGAALPGAPLAQDRNEGGVVRGMRRMEKQLIELSGAVDALSERLSMIRIPYPGSTQDAGKTAEGSSLAAQLSSYNQALECQTARLQQLLQELDL
jgi:hypothetical protein